MTEEGAAQQAPIENGSPKELSKAEIIWRIIAIFVGVFLIILLFGMGLRVGWLGG